VKTEWTPESFKEFLRRHGTLGPWIGPKDAKPYNTCVDGWLNLETICDELNARDADNTLPDSIKEALNNGDGTYRP